MGGCLTCIADRSPCCVRVLTVFLCCCVCLGPLLLLAGIAMYFVPYYAVRYTPQAYEYNVRAALFANQYRNMIQSIKVEASSAVPILGTLGVYHDLSVGNRLPPLQGIRFGVAMVPSVSHFGEAGALLGGITSYYQFRVTGGGLSQRQIVPINADGRAVRTQIVTCTWADTCTDVNIDFCIEGLDSYSGASTCKRDATCGTCQGTMFLMQVCALVSNDSALIIAAGPQGCYFPFQGSGDYSSPSPLKEVAVQFMHMNDPYVVLQSVTKGTNDLGINFVLYSVVQDVAAGVAILAAGIVVLTIIVLCLLFYNQRGRQNAQRIWEKFLGVEQPEDVRQKAAADQPIADNTGSPPVYGQQAPPMMGGAMPMMMGGPPPFYQQQQRPPPPQGPPPFYQQQQPQLPQGAPPPFYPQQQPLQHLQPNQQQFYSQPTNVGMTPIGARPGY